MSNTNPIKHRWWFQVIRKSRQFCFISGTRHDTTTMTDVIQIVVLNIDSTYLHNPFCYLCMNIKTAANSLFCLGEGVFHIAHLFSFSCCVFCFVCPRSVYYSQYCLFLWIFHSWLIFRFSLTFIRKMNKSQTWNYFHTLKVVVNICTFSQTCLSDHLY